MLAIVSDPRSSGGLQRRQIHLAVLARNRDLSAAAALVLLHAGDAMITGVIQLDFAVAGIDRQPLLIAEKCVARLILTAAEFGCSPSSSGHQRSGAFMGDIGFIFGMGSIRFKVSRRSVRNFQRSVTRVSHRGRRRAASDAEAVLTSAYCSQERWLSHSSGRFLRRVTLRKR